MGFSFVALRLYIQVLNHEPSQNFAIDAPIVQVVFFDEDIEKFFVDAENIASSFRRLSDEFLFLLFGGMNIIDRNFSS